MILPSLPTRVPFTGIYEGNCALPVHPIYSLYHRRARLTMSAPPDPCCQQARDTLETITSSSSSSKQFLLPGVSWPSLSMPDLIAGTASDEQQVSMVHFVWKHRQDHLRKGVTAAGDAKRLLAVFPCPIPEDILQDWQKRIEE
jgi:hypothetical protein